VQGDAEAQGGVEVAVAQPRDHGLEAAGLGRAEEAAEGAYTEQALHPAAQPRPPPAGARGGRRGAWSVDGLGRDPNLRRPCPGASVGQGLRGARRGGVAGGGQRREGLLQGVGEGPRLGRTDGARRGVGRVTHDRRRRRAEGGDGVEVERVEVDPRGGVDEVGGAEGERSGLARFHADEAVGRGALSEEGGAFGGGEGGGGDEVRGVGVAHEHGAGRGLGAHPSGRCKQQHVAGAEAVHPGAGCPQGERAASGLGLVRGAREEHAVGVDEAAVHQPAGRDGHGRHP